MLPAKEQFYLTESYVSSPPAARITDERNDVWSLGYVWQQSRDAPQGEFSFNVLRNGCETGEFASRIERRNGKVRIFTRNGFKTWTGKSFL
jgi:hypothetical protein